MPNSPHALIAGAGIGGLTTALCLARIGYQVTILEQSKTLQEAGAGLQISPNASAILRDLGILPALAGSALAPAAIHIRRDRDGATLARLPLADAEARWGAPYLLVHRADLQRALLDAVNALPNVTLATGSRVAGFATTADGMALAILHGLIRTKCEGSCLIGADGLRSFVRERLGCDSQPLPPQAARVAFRALIDAADVPAALRLPESTLWMGRKAHVVHYPLRGGKVINVVAVADMPKSVDWAREFWSEPAETRDVAHRFSGFARPLRDLIAAAAEWRCWPLIERPPLATWVQGPIALLGDAAHPMLPFLAQGAAQAIEDAAALTGALLDSANPTEGFSLYQQRRIARAHRIQAESHRQERIYHLAGPAAFARNIAMRLAGPRRLLDRYDWIYRAGSAGKAVG